MSSVKRMIRKEVTQTGQTGQNTRPGGGSGGLQPVEKSRLYELVMDRLLSHIVQNSLKAGDRLPSERSLGDLLGVSRTSIRLALAALEAQGIVEVRHGEGSFLREISADTDAYDRLASRRRHLPEVLEARHALETKNAELAALRRTARDLSRIEQALVIMEQEVADGGIGMEGDASFHRSIALASQNKVLVELMDILQPSITETRFESLSQPGRPPRSLASHRAIYEAIKEGDDKKAVAAMRSHIQLVSDVSLLRWDPPR